jgi:hypothetical protein
MQTAARNQPLPAPDLLQLPQDRWAHFFDGFTRALFGKLVEIEVIGLDLGDQIQAEWLPLNGLTYDRHDDTLYVYIEETEGRDLDHAIAHPREVHVQLGPTGLERVIAIDADRRQHIVRLREPLALPPGAVTT